MKFITVLFSIIGAGLTLAPWAKVPYVGEINGLQNGSGMFSLLALSIIIIITLSLKNLRTIAMVNSMLCAAILAGYLIYYNNVSQAQNTSITVWGVTVGDMADLFKVLPGFYWASGIVLAMLLINLSDLVRGNDEGEELVQTKEKELTDVQ